jgi:2-oxoglutarate dehydrogenase E2 component (dihydrolipoamide succinyltransferase)
VETPAGDSIAIRHMMYLSMSYDHRIVDGSLGATFLTAVAKSWKILMGKRNIDHKLKTNYTNAATCRALFN